MKDFNIKELIEFLKQSGEQDEFSEVELTELHADTEFSDMGFDSLALLNVVEHLKQKFGIEIPYDIAVTAKTPKELLALIQKNTISHT
ncbi:acyl carrier protein [Xenorhabdus stockiae]|uniref:Acyl carrier protein n=1 Tax=Xenorhabdus stockiae TaxID=351614 RepID=A0A2D0KSL9_9GAMM|nr:acyl carrier protein [Xenorhabdus stockiae]PHM66368.1 acyl carrier protein [Xenorhabdus stockiae]